MITISSLKEFGADVDTGLARCLNKEDFYLKMVNMGLADEHFDQLDSVLEQNNLDKSFEVCHALKGVLGNLALNPMYDIVCEMTELLRARKEADYPAMWSKVKQMRQELLSL